MNDDMQKDLNSAGLSATGNGPIIATVTETKREPRPTLTGSIFLSPRGIWVATTTMHGACDPACRGTFTIPGELESARLTCIEKARQAVIEEASLLSQVDGPDRTWEERKQSVYRLQKALATLVVAEKEPTHGT